MGEHARGPIAWDVRRVACIHDGGPRKMDHLHIRQAMPPCPPAPRQPCHPAVTSVLPCQTVRSWSGAAIEPIFHRATPPARRVAAERWQQRSCCLVVVPRLPCGRGAVEPRLGESGSLCHRAALGGGERRGWTCYLLWFMMGTLFVWACFAPCVSRRGAFNMKKMLIGSIALAVVVGMAVLQAQQPGQPQPAKEHQWLRQLVGEWETEAEIVVQPGQPPVSGKGTESVRSIGGFWTLSEVQATLFDQPLTGIMTLGYDPEKKRYVGTWIDSMSHHLWQYEGSLDEVGRVLTLEAEGPNMIAPGTTARFRETIEIKSKDYRVFTSSIEVEPGKWQTFLTVHYRRKK